MEEEEYPYVDDVDEEKMENYFPFQTQTQIVDDPKKCPIQKKFAKLKVTDIESFNDVVGSLKEKLQSLSKKSSANSKLQIKQLESKLKFLESNRPYVFELAKTFLDARTYSFLQKKNMDFLYYTKGLSHLKQIRGLIRPTAVYFYPNCLHTELVETQSNGRPISIPKKIRSSSGKLIVERLRFFFVDIDAADSWGAVKGKIEDFGMTPDVIVQTSEKSFHLYWSIDHVDLDTLNEGRSGNQLNEKLMLYETGLRSFISFFNADKHRSHASSLMRVPNTWNIKPNKNKKFHSTYLESERTLEVALRKPKYSFDAIIDHLEKRMSLEVLKAAQNEFESRKIKPPELDAVSVVTDDQVYQQMERVKKKAEFDFTLGWEAALESLIKYFKIETKYFEKNDLIILKHMWTYRLCPLLNFPENVRMSLSGGGTRYSELRLTIDKLASLPRKIGQNNVELIFLAEKHKRSSPNQQGRRNGYKVSPMFVESCRQSHKDSQTNWLKRISDELYTKGNRNEGIPFDCFILQTVLQKSRDEAHNFLTDKIQRSANQPDAGLRCSNDTSNIDAWLRYYYK